MGGGRAASGMSGSRTGRLRVCHMASAYLLLASNPSGYLPFLACRIWLSRRRGASSPPPVSDVLCTLCAAPAALAGHLQLLPHSHQAISPFNLRNVVLFVLADDLWTPEGQGQGRKLLRATRRLMQGAAAHTTVPEAAVPQNGAAAPGLTLPANSTIEADYDVDQTKLGEVLGTKGDGVDA